MKEMRSGTYPLCYNITPRHTVSYYHSDDNPVVPSALTRSSHASFSKVIAATLNLGCFPSTPSPSDLTVLEPNATPPTPIPPPPGFATEAKDGSNNGAGEALSILKCRIEVLSDIWMSYPSSHIVSAGGQGVERDVR